MRPNIIFAAIVWIATSPALFAQRAGMSAGMGGARTAFGAGFGISRPGTIGHGHPGNGFTAGFGHRHHRTSFFNPAGFFWGDGFLDGGYWDDQPVVVNEPPAPVVVQTESKAAEAAPPKPSEPVMIEWQGNRFVRLTDAEANASADFASIP